MNTLALRLPPGVDLRRAIEASLREHEQAAAFVVSGIGSLTQARLRFADVESETTIAGPLEILTLAGSVSPDGAHLHMSVSTSTGQVLGGHAGYGSTVRTTAEILIAFLPDWQFARENDAQTGFKELVARKRS